MAVGDYYRAKALELLAHAEIENNLEMRHDLESMAAAYLLLGEQAERNIKLSGIAAEAEAEKGLELAPESDSINFK